MKVPQFSDAQRSLLQAALCHDRATAAAGWRQWSQRQELEAADDDELRLLPAVYANLSRVAPDLELPGKLRGSARSTLTKNTLLFRGCMAIIGELGRHVQVMLTKGMAICFRFDAWSSRPMTDVDLHVPFADLERACHSLAREGWIPADGLTWASLIHRTALRRGSWNLSKDRSRLDLHWRLREGPREEWLARRMWETGERFARSGCNVLVQSPEFALVASINHGFSSGALRDALQTIVDSTWLLPHCRPDRLALVLEAAELRESFDGFAFTLEALGVASARIPPRLGRDRRRRAASTFGVRVESTVVRRPWLYAGWLRLGGKARAERLTLRLAGPFSRPLAKATTTNDYDLTYGSVFDGLAGPGWSWPEMDRAGIWSDRSDARLLVPLDEVGDHVIVLSLSSQRHVSPQPRVNVFVNGVYLATMDCQQGVNDADRVFIVPRHVLWGRWMELSLRPAPYRVAHLHLPDDYFLTRGVPVQRLRVFSFARVGELFNDHGAPQVYLRILRGEQPYAGRWARIQAKMDASPYRHAAELPVGFDAVRYVLSYPDLVEAEVDPYEHYVSYGAKEGRAW